MWLWVLCSEAVLVCPLLVKGIRKDSIGECFESAVLRNMSVTLLLLAVLCAVNRVWMLAAVLFVLFLVAGTVGSYFEREHRLTEATTENIHRLGSAPAAEFRLENGTSMIMAKSGFGMTLICAFSYILCYRHLGLSLALSFLAGFGSGFLQVVTLSVVAFKLFIRRVRVNVAARSPR